MTSQTAPGQPDCVTVVHLDLISQAPATVLGPAFRGAVNNPYLVFYEG